MGYFLLDLLIKLGIITGAKQVVSIPKGDDEVPISRSDCVISVTPHGKQLFKETQPKNYLFWRKLPMLTKPLPYTKELIGGFLCAEELKLRALKDFYNGCQIIAFNGELISKVLNNMSQVGLRIDFTLFSLIIANNTDIASVTR